MSTPVVVFVRVGRGDGGQSYTGKATKAWHCQETQQNIEHLQATLTTVDQHNSWTKHRALFMVVYA